MNFGIHLPNSYASKILKIFITTTKFNFYTGDPLENEHNKGFAFHLIINMVGMDISICCIDKERKEIHLTAAHHTLYMHTDQLLKIKGDPYAIGGAQQRDKKIYLRAGNLRSGNPAITAGNPKRKAGCCY